MPLLITSAFLGSTLAKFLPFCFFFFFFPLFSVTRYITLCFSLSVLPDLHLLSVRRKLVSWLFHFDSPLIGVSTSPRQLHISARPSLLFFLRRHSGPLERSPLPQDLVVRPLVSRVTQKSRLVFNDLSSTTTHALYTTKIPSNSTTLSTSYDF